MMKLLCAGLLILGCNACVVHGHGHGRLHGHREVSIGVGHVHHSYCGHYYRGGSWHYWHGHSHGPSCGHVYRGGMWVFVD